MRYKSPRRAPSRHPGRAPAAGMTPRVLFVSKPIAPPFRDGTKCLVRDVALHVQRVHPIVMSTPTAPPLEQAASPSVEGATGRQGAPVEMVPAYSRAEDFAPTLAQNARAAGWLLLRSHADLWHFVFAPNLRTSMVGRSLRRIRRIPVLQTVASPPRRFTDVWRLLFGDVVVAQSRWTEQRLREASAGHNRPPIEVIPPPVAPLSQPGLERILAQRRELEVLEEAPLFVYPGDLEVSGGAEAVAAVIEPVVRELPDAQFVFACRVKTAESPRIAQALLRRIGPRHARFAGDPTDLMALLAGCTAVLFPVDDLWGKVDLPIVLLEAMSLNTPVVVLDQGPLRDLHGTLAVPPHDPDALARAALDLARHPELRQRIATSQQEAVRTRFSAAVVARAYERLYFELACGGGSG
jgi:glycosyltransferase involved in cell wall biosynthesis